jgi:hypothetical protein
MRQFFGRYTSGRPEDFDRFVAHDMSITTAPRPGLGHDGARDDYENAVKLAGGQISDPVDALVPDGERVPFAWTGTLPSGDQFRGLSLYRVSGGLIRSTRQALIGGLPPVGGRCRPAIRWQELPAAGGRRQYLSPVPPGTGTPSIARCGCAPDAWARYRCREHSLTHREKHGIRGGLPERAQLAAMQDLADVREVQGRAMPTYGTA